MSKKMSYFHSKLGGLNISPAGDGLTAEKTSRLLSNHFRDGIRRVLE
jgi:hypothetical protein